MPESPQPPSLFAWIDSPLLRRIELYLWKHKRIAWIVFGAILLFVFLPQAGGAIWYLFYNEPPMPLFLKKMLLISQMFQFSASWITVPIGIAMFCALFYLLVMGKRISDSEKRSGGIEWTATGTVTKPDVHENCQRTIGNLESQVRRLQRDNETWGVVVAARDEDIARAKKQYEELDQQLTLHRKELQDERERVRLLDQKFRAAEEKLEEFTTPRGKLKVNKGRYWVKNPQTGGIEEEDVTEILDRLILDDKLVLNQLYQRIFPDPLRGFRKNLTIDFSHGNREFSITIPESTIITLPFSYADHPLY